MTSFLFYLVIMTLSPYCLHNLCAKMLFKMQWADSISLKSKYPQEFSGIIATMSFDMYKLLHFVDIWTDNSRNPAAAL